MTQRVLRVNCGDDAACSCRQQSNLGVAIREGRTPHSVRTNLQASEIRTERLHGRDHVVVPVIMARAGVVMNGSLTLEEEFFPEAWNGVPVTVGHPQVAGGHVGANDPALLETWAVGQIFNAHVSGGALRGEAWVDVERAERVAPGLVDQLQSEDVKMDVSTGFFSKEEPIRGRSNGRSYDSVARDLLPDHLALLPGDTGACSWEDGCGVRTNKRREPMGDKLRAAIQTIMAAVGLGSEKSDMTKEQILADLRANARGKDDDHRQMVADLVSDDRSPYTPDDMYALAEMTQEALVATRDTFLTAADEDEEDDEDKTPKPSTNAEGDQPVADNNDAGGQVTVSQDELNKLVTNAVAEALKTALPETVKSLKANALTDDDRAAIAAAGKIASENRERLVTHITTNSDISAESLKSMNLATIETIAAGIRVPVNYGGRATPVVNVLDEKDDVLEAMTPPSLDETIRANRKVN